MPAYKPNKTYGMFGYKGASIDAAFNIDDAEAIRRAHELDWMDRNTRTFMGHSMLKVARDKKAANVTAVLIELGYPE